MVKKTKTLHQKFLIKIQFKKNLKSSILNINFLKTTKDTILILKNNKKILKFHLGNICLIYMHYCKIFKNHMKNIDFNQLRKNLLLSLVVPKQKYNKFIVIESILLTSTSLKIEFIINERNNAKKRKKYHVSFVEKVFYMTKILTYYDSLKEDIQTELCFFVLFSFCSIMPHYK
ncbi:hypothetical protein RFI_16588 [Reticulomyxa filosa]|uniref:Uncharacterized protein n=1 Tax=Reticulomyxa filosa TaxID=46433 RepID=X6N3Y8_RETFI|nr:hypothetical protein RFI_16588 [Reticulomyxa filosa]|eukprot:ETO20628.1 hypothetical protein RFI_16588 [Reticulomyxa filosa]